VSIIKFPKYKAQDSLVVIELILLITLITSFIAFLVKKIKLLLKTKKSLQFNDLSFVENYKTFQANA